MKRAPDDLPHLAYGPFKYDDHGYIWAPSLKGGDDNVACLRGWGYLHGALALPEEEASKAQHAWGHAVVDAVNARFYPPPEKVEATKRLVAALTKPARYVEARCFGETDRVLVSKADLRLLLDAPETAPKEGSDGI